MPWLLALYCSASIYCTDSPGRGQKACFTKRKICADERPSREKRIVGDGFDVISHREENEPETKIVIRRG